MILVNDAEYIHLLPIFSYCNKLVSFESYLPHYKFDAILMLVSAIFDASFCGISLRIFSKAREVFTKIIIVSIQTFELNG